jgi:WD repeat-containing protein 35
MLSNQPDQAQDFCRAQQSKRLWKELGNSALSGMNFTLAEKCFLETANYRTLQFIKRVRLVKDSRVQHAQVLSYMGKFVEAQAIYNSMDRLDLAVEMRRTVGDFESVIEIHVGDDESLSQAHRQVGDSQMEKCDWESAASSYEAAGDDGQLIKCLYLSDDIGGLEKVTERLPATSPLLPVLGQMFVSIGAVQTAVSVFTKCGDIAAAVDACARLNHWKPALKLAGKGRSEEIRRRMNQYANKLVENGQSAAAIDFYAQAGLGIEAAKLLLREGNEILTAGEDYVSAKMCFVFAGLQIEKQRKSAFDAGVTAAERLDGLVKDDEVTTSGLFDDVWRRAEAVHFYLLGHRAMFRRKWINALMCACRVFDEYAEVIGIEKAAALLAICSLKVRHFKQCSRAMTVLEHFEGFSAERRAKFENLAVDIFVKNPPTDPKSFATSNCVNCGAPMSALQSQCTECGTKVKVCVSTGKTIVDDALWQCAVCRHCVMVDLVEELAVCPMCHHQIVMNE